MGVVLSLCVENFAIVLCPKNVKNENALRGGDLNLPRGVSAKHNKPDSQTPPNPKRQKSSKKQCF